MTAWHDVKTFIMAETYRQPKLPLIAHVIFKLDVGGLENGLVNLINNMPSSKYRHAIICLKGYSNFRHRIKRDRDVLLIALGKRDGKDLQAYLRLWRLFRRLRPDIVHTRNIGALDCIIPAALAGVGKRVHSEHGWDMTDLYGNSRKYAFLRRACTPLVGRYVALSYDIERWLRKTVGVPDHKLEHICNGVDTQLFKPVSSRKALPAKGFEGAGTVVIGTVGRMQEVKDQLTLVRAFLRLLESHPEYRTRLRLVMIGDGPLRSQAKELLREANAKDIVWLPGSRSDIERILSSFDVFALPSLNEGLSNTVLEAMAVGLPVVATNVGGNPELVVDGETGMLVPPKDVGALADSLKAYIENPTLRRTHGAAGREKVIREFDLRFMVGRYVSLYDSMLRQTP